MPAITFPPGATHAHQKLDGVIEVFPLGGEQFMNEGRDVVTTFGTLTAGKFVELNAEQLADLVRRSTPAFPIAKKPEQMVNKTKFITDLLVESNGKYTAKEIAQMVVDKFGGDFEKAISFTRAVPWHLKQKNIIVKYKKESEVSESPATVSGMTVAQMDAGANRLAELIAPPPTPEPPRRRLTPA